MQIKNKKDLLPIIQGGMGIGISLSSLAGAVMKEGGIGCISLAMPGYDLANYTTQPIQANTQAACEEIAKAKAIAQGKGMIAINCMVAGNNYDHYVREAVKAGAEAVISGAGLPLKLPEYVNEDTAIAPIVSSGRAARLLLKTWDMHYQRTADFIVIEGYEAGGHLGFKKADLLNGACLSNEEILKEVQIAIQPFEEKYQVKIPLIVAGGVFDGKDVAKYIELGADGVQVGTRFIATKECDASEAFKQCIIDAKEEDIVLIDSPVGFPGRAIHTAFLDKYHEARIPSKHCVNCLIPCNPASTIYCISEALIHAVQGDLDNGLVFCGSNGYRINEMSDVKTIIADLMSEIQR